VESKESWIGLRNNENKILIQFMFDSEDSWTLFYQEPKGEGSCTDEWCSDLSTKTVKELVKMFFSGKDLKTSPGIKIQVYEEYIKGFKDTKTIKECTKETKDKRTILESKFLNSGPEEICLNNKIASKDKIYLLRKLHGYLKEEAEELCNITEKEIKNAKLRAVKRKISQKAREQYGDVPSDDRQPISEDVQNKVWNRDGGKCVKCGSQEKLEFDHIIPVSKGGANTARNIQLLCEKCNREKSNKIG